LDKSNLGARYASCGRAEGGAVVCCVVSVENDIDPKLLLTNVDFERLTERPLSRALLRECKIAQRNAILWIGVANSGLC
jgi:hypothetical protein